MRKSKIHYAGLIYLIPFILGLTLVSTTYGITIGDFENSMDGWTVVDDEATSTAYSTTGATLNKKSLRISTNPANQDVIMYDLIARGKVDAFRKNLKVSADITRIIEEWNEVGDLWCDFYLIIQAGGSVNGVAWEVDEQLAQAAKWHANSGSEPINFTYNYSLTLPEIDFNHLAYLRLVFRSNYGGYNPGGVTYLDNVQMFGAGAAYVPNPLDGAKGVIPESSISWTSGLYAATHDIYFGTNFNDVTHASRTNDPNSVLVRRDYISNTFNPGPLELGQTCYWRIDEVNDAHPDKLWRGDVWSFTTRFSGSGFVLGDWEDSMDGWYVWTNNLAKQSYSTTGATLNKKSLKMTVDFTGTFIWQFGIFMNEEEKKILQANDLFSIDVTFVTPEWLGNGSWGQVRYLAINAEGIQWNQLDNPVSDTSNPAAPGEWNPLSFGEVDTRTLVWDYSGIPVANITEGGYCQFSIGTNQDTAFTNSTYYFDNARFFNSRSPSNPNPRDGQKDVKREPTLDWKSGRNAVRHELYFGSSFNDVNDVSKANLASYPNVTYTSTDVNSFKPGTLNFNTTYYWRVDEIDGTQANSLWKGDVWRFTTGNFIVVDDFEDYNDISNWIFDTWMDCVVNNTGMTVGHTEPGVAYAERTIFHGGSQSMYMRYDNDGSINEGMGVPLEKVGTLLYSETEREWAAPQDWTANGAVSLSLWFKGLPAAVGSFTGSPSLYTMTAGGTDIYGTSDQFHFAYKQFSGVGEIIAKVESISNSTDAWAKAGVMMRETKDADSPNIAVVVTSGSGVSLQVRSTVGGGTEESNRVTGITAPQYVKLSRAGNTFTGEYSSDKVNWKPLGSITMPLSTQVYIGLCLTSHNADATCTATFSNVTLNPAVSGDWAHNDIGIASNIAEPMYVVVEDNAGVSSPAIRYFNPAATTIKPWTPWNILLTDLGGVNLKAIKKMVIGVGTRGSTQPGGSGTLYIDDIRLLLP